MTRYRNVSKLELQAPVFEIIQVSMIYTYRIQRIYRTVRLDFSFLPLNLYV